MVAELFSALFRAAIPVGAVSFVLVFWLLHRGHVESGDDPWAIGRAVEGFGHQRKKASKKEKKARKQRARAAKVATPEVPVHEEVTEPRDVAGNAADSGAAGRPSGAAGKQKLNPMHEKWLAFGGGFYGVIALITYIRIEVPDIIEWLGQVGSLFRVILDFRIDLLIQLFVESLINFVTCIAWPAYWLGQISGRQVWIWLAMAYGGYWAGMRLAWYAHRRYSLAERPEA